MRLFHSIKGKLLSFCLCISLVPITVITIVYYLKASSRLKEHQINELAAIAEAKKVHILTGTEAKKGRTVDFSSDGFIRDRLERISRATIPNKNLVKSLNRHLSISKKPLDPKIMGIAVLNTKGIVVAATHEGWIGKDLSSETVFLQGMETPQKTAYLAPPDRSPLCGEICVCITAPITSRKFTNEKTGIIINCYDLDILHEVTTPSARRGTTGEVYLVNRNMVMITRSRFIEDAPLRLRVDTEPVRKILATGQEMTGTYPDYRGVPVVGVSLYLPEYDWILLSEIDEAELFAPLRSLGIIALMLGSVCGTAVIGMGVLFSVSISRPINRLKNATDKFAHGNLQQRVVIDSGDEIGGLASSFNIMADNLQREIINANKANEAKSLFLSSMSHELRTPMNSILGFAQLLKNDTNEPLSASQSQSVDVILNSGNHLLALINDVLDLSRIESGQLTVSDEPIRLEQVIQEIIGAFESIAENSGITIINKVRQCNMFIKADKTRLKQVLTNLMSNAIKYNKPGGKVTVACKLSGSNLVRLSIQDNGFGIPKEKLTSLFKPFERLGQEKSNIEGTGIGLTITKRLVELMGGSIWVESVEGTGTKFIVEFKKIEAHRAETQSQEKTYTTDNQHIHKPTMKKTLLYIEDNPANMKLVENILKRRESIVLLTATDAESGIRLATEKIPDVILMDINLPGLDGYTALKILKNHDTTKAIPVIAVSANAMLGDIEKGRSAKFADYITKPINVNAFLAALDNALKETGREP